MSRRRCVLVLGMHRSGTSAVTRVINLIGADLPRHLMPASGSNEAGHWEPALIVDISDRLLLESGSAWNDWRPFEPVSAVSPKRLNAYRAEIRRAIEQEFGGSSLFVLKDLRVSRFPAFFLGVLEALGIEARIVIALRHPISVAGSLKARDKMPINDALLLWLRYNVEVEQATRHLDRVVISYEDLMREPGDQIDRLKALIAPEATSSEDLEAARDLLRTELRHHFGHDIETPTFPELGRWATDAYAALQALERDPSDVTSQAMIDLVRTRIDAELSACTAIASRSFWRPRAPPSSRRST